MVLAGKLVWRWKYVGDEEPEAPPNPKPGGPGSPRLELDDIWRRLHMAMGEQAREAGDRMAPFRRLREVWTRWEGVGRGNDRTAILETSIISGYGIGGTVDGKRVEEAQDHSDEQWRCSMILWIRSLNTADWEDTETQFTKSMSHD